MLSLMQFGEVAGFVVGFVFGSFFGAITLALIFHL